MVFQQDGNLMIMNKKLIIVSIVTVSILIIFSISLIKNNTHLESEEKWESLPMLDHGDYEFFFRS